MNKSDFLTMRTGSTIARFKMADDKSVAYTKNSDDRLANFRTNAEKLKLTEEIVWSVYFNKHIDAIMAYTSKGVQGPEGIESNIDDASNYLDLLRAMVRDKNGS